MGGGQNHDSRTAFLDNIYVAVLVMLIFLMTFRVIMLLNVIFILLIQLC